jgi:hypothetical protein
LETTPLILSVFFGEPEMLFSTEQQLKQLERMVECAYLNGFAFDEDKGPRFAAKVLINELRESIINEMILARGRGIVNTALLTD